MLTPQLHRIILVTLFVMGTGNFAFFQHLIQVYPINPDHISFLLSVTVFFTSATLLFFTLLCFGKFGNSLLAIFLLLCSQAAYYMDQYGVIIDSVMLDNVFHTNFQEFSGLVSPTLMARTLFFGILPAWLLIKYPPRMAGFSQELRARLKLVLLLLLLMLIAVAPLTANYATFVRKNKIVRFYANPLFFSSAAVNYARKQFIGGELTTLSRTAQDAVKLGDEGKTKLIILVVGETARADRFSLNGYSRETNPLLKRQGVSSLTRVSSCGTSTGVSLPCMFSALGRARFNLRDAQQQENVLDVLNRHGVEILWRDNNSDSKGVAARVRYEDFKNPANNPVCDNECRDVGMLSGLDRYVETRNHKDILIILHQMGNHGPEYYKRYPKEFERFTPACKTSELSKCSKQEIDNAYDNAILYTDYFLSQAISFLKKYDHQFKTGLLYVSDHGESLGERGIYLHGAPYVFAPKEQTHVPAIVWMGEDFDYSLEQVRPYRDYALSHDDLFCMLLVAFTLESKSCGSAAPILQANRNLHYPAKKF